MCLVIICGLEPAWPVCFDPETLAAGDWGSGKTYPLSKVISFGLNVNF